MANERKIVENYMKNVDCYFIIFIHKKERTYYAVGRLMNFI